MSKSPPHREFLRIGVVAQRSGVSTKALRLYEQRGLLRPCTHSPSGYRLYGPDALQRLMRIVLLKRAGFSLGEIAGLLDGSQALVTELIGGRIAALEREVADKAHALESLRLAARRVGSTSSLDIDQLLESINMSNKLDMRFSEAERAEFKRHGDTLGKHFTSTERKAMLTRAEQLGEAGMQQAQHEWPQLITAVRAAMDAGTPATDPGVIEMGRRWHALVNAFTNGDANTARKMKQAYEKEPEVMAAQGMDASMFTYVGEAMAAAGLTLK
ncbi:MAG: MerR family transcriptional regulator [Rhodanobacteraceae bacterium]